MCLVSQIFTLWNNTCKKNPYQRHPRLTHDFAKFYSIHWLHKVRLSVKTSLVAHHARAYPSFSSIKWLGVFLLPLDGMLVHHRVTPSIKFAGIHLYTLEERGTMWVKCLAQEHNTMSPARARTQTSCSGVKHTNHEDTVPHTRNPSIQMPYLVLG